MTHKNNTIHPTLQFRAISHALLQRVGSSDDFRFLHKVPEADGERMEREMIGGGVGGGEIM